MIDFWLVFIISCLFLVLGYALCHFKPRIAAFLVAKNLFVTLFSTRLETSRLKSSPNVYQNLSQLLNDQPDHAIDAFISSVDINSDTLDVHFSLGSLLRKRGETARAIAVHQNVLQSEGLDKKEKHKAQLHLAIDYFSAGVYDRAESLLKTLAHNRAINRDILHKSLRYLIELYEHTNDWALAIDVADRLTVAKFSGHADEWKQRQAHYCCELSVSALNDKNFAQAKHFVKLAKSYDALSARAFFLESQIEIALNDYSSALVAVRQLPEPSAFTSELLHSAYKCHSHLDTLDAFESYVLARYARESHLIYVYYLLRISQQQPLSGRLDLIDEVRKFTQLDDIDALLDAFLSISSKEALNASANFTQYIIDLLERYLEYRCQKCGFAGKKIHWLCPGCRTWNTVMVNSELTT